MKIDSSAWRDKNDSDEVGQLFVLNEGKVLILKRSDWMAWAPNQWALPGGHIEYGELPRDGALRELREETSLEAFEAIHFESDEGLHYYIVDDFNGDVKLNNEHTEHAWIDSSELNKYDIVPIVKKRIQKLFTSLRG